MPSPAETAPWPPVIAPADAGAAEPEALAEAVEADRDLLQTRLTAEGALLFRGYTVDEIGAFERFVRSFSGGDQPFAYAGGASPRNKLGGGVYTSTEYPPEVGLSLHNELSYADVHPRRLFFCCLVAPYDRGETTLGDSRRILADLSPAIVDAFKARGVRYVRNLSPVKGSGYSWQEALETDDPAVAEACCRRIGAEFAWRADGGLRLSQVRPATARHPLTGEEVWFNQADGFHPSALDPATHQALLAACGSEDQFRLNAYYGDGSPIEPAAVRHIREVLEARTVAHSWRAGDILVLDNLLTAHGRRPFSGSRKIALAMT